MASELSLFGDAVERGLSRVNPPNTSLGPRRLTPEMRTVRGRVIPQGVPRISGGAGAAGSRFTLKGLGKAAAPLAAAEQAYQTGKLILSEEARDQAAQDYKNLADEGALTRAVKGGLGGVTTIYGAGRALGELADATSDAKRSQKQLEEKQKDPENIRLLDEAKKRQALYMSLPKEEQSKIDKMRGREAKLYLQDLMDAKVAPRDRPASSEPKPPSSPATAGAQKSSLERQMVAPTEPTAKEAPATKSEGEIPKAIPVKESEEDFNMGRALALFQHTHGGPFDPKSSMDRNKMAAIQNLMSQKGSENLTPNQFALRIYRQS